MLVHDKVQMALLRHCGEAAAVLSPDGAVIYINEASSAIFGLEPDRLVGSDFMSLIHPDDHAIFRRQFHYRVESPPGSTGSVFFRFYRADGRCRHAEALLCNLLDDKEVRGITANMRDVTELREVELRLRGDVELREDITGSSLIGIFQSDATGAVTTASSRFAEIVGVTPEEALGIGWTYVVDPVDRDRMLGEWRRCRAAGELLRIDLRFTRPNGQQVVALLQAVPVNDPDGHCVGSVGTLTDLSNYMRTVEALMLSEARHNAILDAAPDAIVTIDAEAVVRNFNHAAEEMFGYTAEEMLLRPVHRLIPEGDLEQHFADLAMLKAGENTRLVNLFKDIRLVRCDGTLFCAEAMVSRIDVGGQQLFIGILRDLTERKRIERELIQAKEAVETADRTKTAFRATVTSALRTPLHSIIGASQMIEMQSHGPLGSDRYQEHAATIHRASRSLLDIIDDILDITAIESGSLRLANSMLDADEIVRQSVSLMERLADDAGVTLAFEKTEPLPGVRGDALRLRQVLVNLLSNAIRFTPPGGEVTIGLRAGEGGELAFDVRDTGIGMTPEQVFGAFGAFSRFDDVGNLRRGKNEPSSGAGLGLTLSRRLVELHGGRLEITSKAGQGTTVTVLLPSLMLTIGKEAVDRAPA